MKATTGFAALATMGLLALAGCSSGGGDGDAPKTEPSQSTVMDTPPPTLGDAQSANSADIRRVTAQAANSLPRFGSVVQAAGEGLANASGVSTSFDGSHLTVTVSRDDGSTLTLNTDSEGADGSEPYESPLAGHSAQDWTVVNFDTEGISVVRALLSANDGDSADYLTGGYWAHLAGNLLELSFTGVEIGAFVDGPELSLASPPALPVQGTASYYGRAAGTYAVLYGTGDGATPGSTELGEFFSGVALTADFAGGTIGGCMGCSDGVALAGTLHDAGTGEETDVFAPDSGYRLHLEDAAIDANGTFLGRQLTLEHAVISIDSTAGAWGGQFSNIADSAGDPRLAAGTFGAEATSAGGSQGSFLGSFIGTRN